MSQTNRTALMIDCLGWAVHNERMAGRANRLTIAARRQDNADRFLADAIGWASA